MSDLGSRPMNMIGVDPGVHGALSLFVGGELVELVDIPTTPLKTGKTRMKIAASGAVEKTSVERLTVDPHALYQRLLFWAIAHRNISMGLESVTGIPGQSAPAAFSFGTISGFLEMAAISLTMPLYKVPPARWQAAMGCGKDKKNALTQARNMFPKFASYFARVKDDGRADAALIGAYTLRIVNAQG